MNLTTNMSHEDFVGGMIIAISPTINTPISTVTNMPISLTSSDFDILMGIETDPVFILGEKKGVR